MNPTVAYTEADVCNFVKALRPGIKNRDNRSKRYTSGVIPQALYLGGTQGKLEVRAATQSGFHPQPPAMAGNHLRTQ